MVPPKFCQGVAVARVFKTIDRHLISIHRPARAEARPSPGNPVVLRPRREGAGRTFVGSVGACTDHRPAAYGARIESLWPPAPQAARGASSKAANPAAIASPAVAITRSAGDHQPPSISRPSAIGCGRCGSLRVGCAEDHSRSQRLAAAGPPHRVPHRCQSRRRHRRAGRHLRPRRQCRLAPRRARAPGGICISADAWRHVRGAIAAEFVDLGEKRLKNIADPAHVFALSPEG